MCQIRSPSCHEQSLLARSQAIHAATPMTKMNEADPGQDPVVMTDAEVVTAAETWYDSFHAS